MLSPEEADCLERLLKNFKLPTEFGAHRGLLLDALHKARKRSGENIPFVLLRELGRAEVMQLSCSELEDHLQDLC